MRISLKTLENQDYQDLILTLDIVVSDIANVSNRLSNNHFRTKIYTAKKAPFTVLADLYKEKSCLLKELNDLTNYYNQIISQLN